MKVTIKSSDGVVGTFDLAEGEHLVGSREGLRLRLDSLSVALEHARLRVGPEGAVIDDLGSGWPTYLDGRQLAGTRPLRHGSTIRIGEFFLEISDREFGAQTKGRYHIGKVVGEGGMGVVWSAHEASTGREVAMKQIKAELGAGNAARFAQEARITAHLEHPNIVPVHEVSGGAGGPRYYTMKMVRGASLEKILAGLAAGHAETVREYPLAALLTIFQKVCDAVAFAHSHGVIHRDLKPANLMVGEYGEVLVMDWGLAKVGDEGAPELLAVSGEVFDPFAGVVTQPGAAMGTPQYMSPEQACGATDAIDARSDIYSLGGILYHLLVLRPAVTGRSSREVVEKVKRGQLEDLHRGTADGPRAPADPVLKHLPGGRIPDSLASVVRKAMAFEAEARYASVAELQAEITAYQQGFATAAEDASVWKQLTLLVRRHRLVAGTVAASLLCLAGISAFYVASVRTERDRAKELAGEKEIERKKAVQQTAVAEMAKDEAEAARAQATAEQERAREAQAQAEAESRIATAAKAEAQKALADLRKTAPVLHQQAYFFAYNLQNFPKAIELVRAAIELDPDDAQFLLTHAHLLQASERLREAGAIYEKVFALRADAKLTESARVNVELCARVLQSNGDGPLSRESRTTLVEELRKQERDGDTVLLAAGTAEQSRADLVEIDRRLSSFARENPSLHSRQWRRVLTDGSFQLDFSGLPASRLPDLKGLEVTVLILDGAQFRNLDGLAGSKVRKLSANRTKINDLRPLAGLSLVDLSLHDADLTDLSVSVLRGLRLRRLVVSDNPGVKDFRPLSGMPLEELVLDRTNIEDLGPVLALPLRRLSLVDCRQLRDLSLLQSCRTLEALVIPRTDGDLLGLRSLPWLQRMGDRFDYTDANRSMEFSRVTPAAAFWRNRGVFPVEVARLNHVWDRLPVGGMTTTTRPKLNWNTDGLIDLDLTAYPPVNLEMLRHLPIAFLNLHGVGVTDFSPLADTPVRDLILGGDRANKLAMPRFETLRQVQTLRRLGISDSAFSDLGALAGLKLEELNFPYTAVADLRPITSLKTLRSLEFTGTPVTDVHPLLHLPDLKEAVFSPDVDNAKVLNLHPGGPVANPYSTSPPPRRTSHRSTLFRTTMKPKATPQKPKKR